MQEKQGVLTSSNGDFLTQKKEIEEATSLSEENKITGVHPLDTSLNEKKHPGRKVATEDLKVAKWAKAEAASEKSKEQYLTGTYIPPSKLGGNSRGKGGPHHLDTVKVLHKEVADKTPNKSTPC